MANYYGTCRSNYFRVKDSEAFEREMDQIHSIAVQKGKDNTYVILGDCPDGGGWPSWDYEDNEIDLPLIVSTHLADDEVAVFMEAGAEKLRYIVGYAEAINSRGERASIGLNDIYKLAENLGSSITVAEY